MSRWISSENVFVAPTRKGETLPKWADLLKNELFVFLEEGESFSTRVCSPAEQRLEIGPRCFPKLEKNWTRQLTMNNYFDWKGWAISSFQSTSSWFGSGLPEKINMRVTTSQYEIYLISGQNSHLPSQNVFLQSVIYSTKKTIILAWGKVLCFLPIPLFYTGEITMTVGRCTELEELFAWTNIW